YFDHDADTVVNGSGNQAFCCGSAFTFGSALQTFDTDNFHGLIDIAVGFVESFLDVHHACASTLAQGLNVFDCVIRHYRYPIPWMFVAGVTRESKNET